MTTDSPKYNRTLHFPWSPGATNDDKIASSITSLLNTEIVITEKMDGSNTSLELDGCFSRSHSGPPTHASFDGLKALHSSIKWKLSKDLQLFGEWCYALHSIQYNELPNYFLLFNVRDLINSNWLSWEEVEMWSEEIGVPTVPVLFKGKLSSEKELKDLTESLTIKPSSYGDIREGVVVRVTRAFKDFEFSQCIMKWVRKDHVTTDTHWKHHEIIKNKLKI